MDRRLTAVAAAGALLLAGCGDSSDSGSSTTTQTVTQTVESTASASSKSGASRTTAPSSGNPLTLGQTFKTSSLAITVSEVKSLRVTENGQWDAVKNADDRFVAFRVKTCTKEASPLSWSPWKIVGADDGQYPALDITPTPTEFPRPAYPHATDASQVVPAGQCRSGWIVAPMTKDTQPSRISYRNSDGDAREWAAK